MSLGLLLTTMKNSVDLHYTRHSSGNQRRWGSQTHRETKSYIKQYISESEIADGLAESVKKIGRDV